MAGGRSLKNGRRCQGTPEETQAVVRLYSGFRVTMSLLLPTEQCAGIRTEAIASRTSHLSILFPLLYLHLFISSSLLGCGDYTEGVGENAFSSSCCIWSLLCVLCWLMASSPAVGAGCGPWVLLLYPGSINLYITTANLKGLLVSSYWNGYRWSAGHHSVGLDSPSCAGSAGILQEDEHLPFLHPTPQFRIIR